MKKILSVILLLLVIAMLLGGCTSQEEKEVLDQAWDIVKDVPLPDAGYSGTTGHKLVLSEVKIEIDGYSTTTGEPYLVVTCEAKDPNPPCFRLEKRNEHEGEFILLFPYGSAQEVLAVGRGHLLLTDRAKFTLSELKELRDMLHWSRW